MSRQELARDLIIGGGFFTGIATVIVAFISSGDAQQARTLQSQEQARVIISRQYRDQLENQRSLCATAIGYIEDEKPNVLLTGPQKQIAMEAVVSGLRNCSAEMPKPPSLVINESVDVTRNSEKGYLLDSKGVKP